MTWQTKGSPVCPQSLTQTPNPHQRFGDPPPSPNQRSSCPASKREFHKTTKLRLRTLFSPFFREPIFFGSKRENRSHLIFCLKRSRVRPTELIFGSVFFADFYFGFGNGWVSNYRLKLKGFLGVSSFLCFFPQILDLIFEENWHCRVLLVYGFFVHFCVEKSDALKERKIFLSGTRVFLW